MQSLATIYNLYLQCWYSGQIPEADMVEKLNADPKLKEYYEKQKEAKQ